MESGNWLWFLLDLSWTRLIVFTVLLYCCVAFVLALTTYALGDGAVSTSLEYSGSSHNLGLCMLLSITSVVTCGYGVVAPATPTATSVVSVHQFVGLVLNVLLFSIVVTKVLQTLCRDSRCVECWFYAVLVES